MLRWVAGNIHLERLLSASWQISGWGLLGSLLINLLALALCGVRMSLLLEKDFYTAFSVINIGYALNTLLPLRLGEPVKLYLARKLFHIPLTGAFAASVAEKLFDLVMMLFLIAAILAFTTGKLVQFGVLISVGALVLIVAAITILFRRYVVSIIKFFPKKSRLRRISIELHKHSSGYRIGHIFGVTASIWTLHAFLVFLSFNTYLPELDIGIWEALTLLMVMGLAIAIPSAPAGVGLFEAGIVAYLTQAHNIGNEAALVAATAFHFVITFPQLLVTLWLLWSRRRELLGSGVE